MAEGQGFEPWVRRRTLVFKTSAFDHSATPPEKRGASITCLFYLTRLLSGHPTSCAIFFYVGVDSSSGFSVTCFFFRGSFEARMTSFVGKSATSATSGWPISISIVALDI